MSIQNKVVSLQQIKTIRTGSHLDKNRHRQYEKTQFPQSKGHHEKRDRFSVRPELPVGTKNVNEAIDNTEEVKKVIGELSDLFGGATATPSIGGWRCENGEVVVENTTIVYSFCTTEQAIKHAGDVLAIAQRLCREYNQEAVTVEYNGQVKFVTV